MPGKREVNLIKLFVVLLIILFLFCFFNSFFGIFEKRVCGDGTRYEECSKTLPYFCSGGTLVQDTSFCKCPKGSVKKDGSCEYKYQTSPNLVSLNYTLKGKSEKINFIVYGGMVDYLKEHPQSSFYSVGKNYSLQDFKLRIVEEPEQKKLLMPLVIEIQNAARDKEDQARIAISLVQNIPYEDGAFFEGVDPRSWSLKYPYNVLYQQEGLCGSKSDLLAFLLKEIGYEVVIFHYYSENHEAVGIKCPKRYSLRKTGYCFVESTQPAIISYSSGGYSEQGKLYSVPEIIPISKGISLKGNMEEYRDAAVLTRLYQESEKNNGKTNLMEYIRDRQLTEKYGLENYF